MVRIVGTASNVLSADIKTSASGATQNLPKIEKFEYKFIILCKGRTGEQIFLRILFACVNNAMMIFTLGMSPSRKKSYLK